MQQLTEKEWTRETLMFIEEHADEDVRTLALQASRYPNVQMTIAVSQIAARQTARMKLPTWWNIRGIRYPQHLPMEQCSSETTARYKTTLIPRKLLSQGITDLSGGFGVDFCMMAQGFEKATYVERQEELCRLATYNFKLLGLSEARIVYGDAVDYLNKLDEHQGIIYIDPARRGIGGRKTIAVSDCEPDISVHYEKLIRKATRVIVKLSPMLDIAQALKVIPVVSEVHVVAVAGECKELLLVMERNAVSEKATIVCVNLPLSYPIDKKTPFRFTLEEEWSSEPDFAEKPERYLYEPDSTLMKAGAYRTISARFGLRKLHPNSHLYTSESNLPDFPGRVFQIEMYGGFGKEELRRLRTKVEKANLTVRNFPAKVDELRKRMKLAEGGDDYLFATTLNDGTKCWIWCKKTNVHI